MRRYVVLAVLFLAHSPFGLCEDTVAGKDVLIFSAPPRENAEEGAQTYKPLTDYLSRVTGKTVQYRWPRTWGVYRTEMINGRYDIVFDGPHFTGWRVQKLKWNLVAKVAGQRDYAIFTRKDSKINSVADLAGHTVCTQSPPNLNALILSSQFEKSAAQPILVPSKGLEKTFDSVLTGRCFAGVLPTAQVTSRDTGKAMKLIYTTEPMPDQAFSVGPRINAQLQAKIAAALIAPEALAPTEKLRKKFQGGDRLVAATNQEYVAYADLLKSEWGFNDEPGSLAARDK